MVRLAFRSLVRKFDCDICFTPMIVAPDFMCSVKARDTDHPLIVQFAASDAQTLADAACVVSPFSDGVDLNCGCPQRWAMSEGYGACLLNKPENQVDNPNYTASIKIRIHKDLLSVPVIANRDIKTHRDTLPLPPHMSCLVGVMAGRGLLSNPAMFTGYNETPLECVWDWVDLTTNQGTPFTCFHQHLIYMLERVSSQPERKVINSLQSSAAVIDYLHNTYGSKDRRTLLVLLSRE
uniref:Dihydrouridine synthase 4-like (S. cerevisiae) n=1 Tax=Oncorhynchus mykiss TaxID=8022 RepID=A0A8C7UQ69_ONCMY